MVSDMSKWEGKKLPMERDLHPSKRTLDRTALKGEKFSQGYYDVIVKTADNSVSQAGHKPYQCDIKLK